VEGVEDQASVAGTDLVGGETPDHFIDGLLEVGLGGGEREGEGLTATAAPAGVWEGLAVGVVIVAEGFALELRFLDRLLLDISEATLGQPEPPVLEALSTTNPMVAIFAQPQVLEVLAKAVNLFLDAWAKIEEIRKVRADVSRIGISGAALQQFDEKIEETVTEVVEESVKMSLSSYSSDNGRKNELGNALSQDMRRLFGQIERGLIVEFRAEPDKKADDENAQSLLNVRDIGKGLRYPTPEAQPLLLASGEVLEGEITRTTKKKTITTKVVKRDGASEPSSKQ